MMRRKSRQSVLVRLGWQAMVALAATSVLMPLHATAADGATVLAAGSSAEAATSDNELDELVAPVALYPDDLLAIVLPAASHPLQIVQASRYLEAREADPDLSPDPDWDEAVLALLNYPEVLAQLNEDLDWTAALGAAVAEREAAVLAAVTRFRQRADRAGNLSSDRHQVVEREGDTISIRPADPEVIYVPDYEPARVVIHEPTFVYRYYPRPFPVYYYPYPAGHTMLHDDFWGLTRVYRIGWHDRRLQLFLHQHRGHPYYARRYPHGYYDYYRLDRYDRYRPRPHGRRPHDPVWHNDVTRRELAPRGERIEKHERPQRNDDRPAGRSVGDEAQRHWRTRQHADLRTTQPAQVKTERRPRPATAPAARSIKQPAARSIKEPAARSIKQPAARSLKEPAARSIKQPAARSIKEPAARAFKQPPARPPARPQATSPVREQIRSPRRSGPEPARDPARTDTARAPGRRIDPDRVREPVRPGARERR